MDPNADIPVAEFANAVSLLQPNLSLWITNCLSISVTKQDVWTSEWIEFLRAGLRGVDSKTIVEKYQQLTEQFSNMLKLKQQYSTDDNTQNDWASTLLLNLLVMYVYRKSAIECYPNQLVEFYQTMPWIKHAVQVITMAPKGLYLHQLHQLVYKAIYEKPIDRTVDRALLKIQRHALNFYFEQFLDELHNTTQDCMPSDEEDCAYNRYAKMVGVLGIYIGEIDNSSLKEKETAHLSKLLLEQLTQLIETTSTLDLSPSWVERLKQWIQECISQLTSLYTTTPSAAKTSYLRLLAISERLRKSTKKAVRNKKLQSPELIREGCWLYFSLHEQLITQWVDKKKHAIEYQSTALALFESFMSTFDWPIAFKKGILHENPLKAFGWFARFKEGVLHGNSLKLYQNTKQDTPVEHWEPLVDKALNKLCADFFMRDWAKNHGSPSKSSFLQWLLSRQEPRLIAKIKAHVSTEAMECQRLNEISTDEKINLYGFVQEIHKDFCTDLNQITQMILSVWLQKIGFSIPHKKLDNILSKPGRWLCQTNQALPTQLDVNIPFFALFMSQAIERLGAGVYFFPLLQQYWSAYQEALALHSGSAAEFAYQHDEKIAVIIKRLLFIFHTDHKPGADSNPRLKSWAQNYVPKINSVKHDLEKFRKRDLQDLQSLDAITEAQALLNKLRDVVLDGMGCHLSSVPHISELQQMEVNIAKAHKEIEEIRKDREEIRKDREEIRKDREEIRREREEIHRDTKVAQAKVARLETLLAKQQAVKRKPRARTTISRNRSRATLFPIPTTSRASDTAAANPVLPENSYVP